MLALQRFAAFEAGGCTWICSSVHRPQPPRSCDHTAHRRGAVRTNLPAPDDAYLKVESFGGTGRSGRLWPNAATNATGFTCGCAWTSSARLHGPLGPVPGISVKGMSEDLWPELHRVVTESFRDHRLPSASLRPVPQGHDQQTTDLDRWRTGLRQADLRGSLNRLPALQPEAWVMWRRSVSFGSTAGVASPGTCCWTPWPETLRRASREVSLLRRDADNRRNSATSVGMRRDHEVRRLRTLTGQ